MTKRISALIFIINFLLYPAQNDLSQRINDILKGLPKNTKYGIMIYDPILKDTIISKNIYAPIKPASNTKLFTTAVAFALMGGDHKLSTKLLTDDFNINDGIINGNLFIKGYGNSLFTDSDLDSLVNKLKAIGIKEIKGNIIGDDTYFDNEYKRSDWIMDEPDADPLPPVSAIVINRNKIYINCSAVGKTGTALQYSLNISSDLFTIKNLAKVTRRKSSVRISQSFNNGKYEIILSGGLRRGRSGNYSIEIENPPLFAALFLKDKLLKEGIAFSNEVTTGAAPEVVNELCDKSILLRNLISIINKRSDNYLAECLFKTLGAFYSDKQGNSFYSTQAILSYLNENHIFTGGTVIVDGSGLSHSNNVSPLTIVNLLERIYRNPSVYFDYYNSLSIAGRDGTLRNRLIRTNAENNFHGKTGSLHGVISLSGYLKSSEGKDLIVSIIFEFSRSNERTYKSVADRIIQLL